MIEWTQGDSYPGHSGAIVQWKGPGQDYDASRQHDAGFMSGFTGLTDTIPGLSAGVEYTIRVITTRRFAEDGAPSPEMTGTPFPPIP